MGIEATPDLTVEDKPANDYQVDAHKNITPPEVEPEADKVLEAEDEKEAETDSAEDALDEQDKKPKLKGYKKKIAKLEAEIRRLQAQPVVGVEEVELNPDDFDTYDAYEDAKLEKKLEKQFSEFQKKQNKAIEQTISKERANLLISRFNAQKEEAREVHVDYDQVIKAYDENPSNPKPTALLQEALLESDKGAEVLYYLANNPKEVAYLGTMGERELYRYLGKLEVQLEKNVPAVKTTNAPPPIKPVTKATVSSSNFHSDMSFEEYKRLRASGKI